MKRFQIALLAATLLLISAQLWASCLDNRPIIHQGMILGGFDLAGTEYDGTCAGMGGCTPVNRPHVRIWEQGFYATANEGVAEQFFPPCEHFVINWAMDADLRPETGVWSFYHANWWWVGTHGCPAPDSRTVAEISFCDSATHDAWYLAASVPEVDQLTNFDLVQGADGPHGSVIPATRVPVPEPLPGERDIPSPGYVTIPVNLDGELNWWTENGHNDPANRLIAGYELLYRNMATVPVDECEADPTAWAPVLDPIDPTLELGAVQPGAAIAVVVPTPAPGETVYLAARVWYNDTTEKLVSPRGRPSSGVIIGAPTLAPVAIAGGPYGGACIGGIHGIWMDGEASFDPDAGDTITFKWTTTCSASFEDSTAARTTATFDCDPCRPLDCEVTLTVTDQVGKFGVDTVAVTTAVSPKCVPLGNTLCLAARGDQVDTTWPMGPPANNFAVYRSEGDKQMGGPRRLTCAPPRSYLDDRTIEAGISYYSVSGMDEPCAAR